MREHGLSEVNSDACKIKYAGTNVAELARLKYLEEENPRPKRMFADLSIENQAIREIMQKN